MGKCKKGGEVLSRLFYEQFLHVISRKPDQFEFPIRLNKDEIVCLCNEIKALDYSMSEDLNKIAAYLHFGQASGGEQFITAFDFDECWKTQVVSAMKKVLPTLSPLSSIGYESKEEREWRFDVYRELSNHVAGFDSYFSYQSSTLIYETEGFLSEQTCFFLDAIALLNPEEFVLLCNGEKNPLWSLRWLARINNISSNIVLDEKIFTKFLLSNQGILSAYLWDKCLAMEEHEFHIEAHKLLLFHSKFPKIFFLEILARVLSNITTKRFSSLTHLEGKKKYKQQLELLLDLGATQLLNLFPLTEEEVKQFASGFYNLSNKEPLWACLEIAKRIEEKSSVDEQKKTIQQLRQLVISRYPSYWEKKDSDCQYYFSEELTLKLVEELALAMVANDRVTSLEQLKYCESIPSLEDLYYMRDAHEYGQLFRARELLWVHAYLAAQLLINSSEQKEILTEKWEGFFKFILDFTIIDSAKNSLVFQSVKRAVFKTIGALFSIYGYPDAYSNWLNCITDPLDYLSIIKGDISLEKQTQLFELMEQKLPYYQFVLKPQEILELGYEMYNVENYPLATALLSEIDEKNLKPEQASYWKKIISTAYLNIAFESVDSCEQIQNLKIALKYSQIKLTCRSDLYLKENHIVAAQIIGWLFDRDEATNYELLDAYRLISCQSQQIENGMLQEDYYVRSLILVRLLSSTNSPNQIHSDNMKISIEKMGDIPGHQLTQALLRAWYSSFTDKTILQKDFIVEHEQDFRLLKQWLPKPLQTLLEEINDGEF